MPPLEHDVRLKDGSLPPPWMPQRVSEPEDIGFSPSGIKIIDFGFSFIPQKDCAYFSWHFPKGGVPAPELLKSIGQTALPFKVDSWGLGNVIYFVLTGWNCFAVHNLDEYRLSLDELRAGQNESINELPEDVKSLYLPLILGLLEMDPEKRLAIEEISQGPCSEAVNVDQDLHKLDAVRYCVFIGDFENPSYCRN
ncbi:hypothetical protein BB8028_0004g13440 [Beauveria bassiana]|uniref:Protein kinase domain-containing protein n=1 Tax=Beauveria bassiana TaxID=176275 RepID=A0A2S7YEI0_BEABA|nr:hypothetical protein BB8028_0004g13440 [Beauveria bassiana]